MMSAYQDWMYHSSRHACAGSPYTSLVWRRAGGRALPPGHSVADGKLLIPRITSEYAGVYECSVVSQTGDVSMASVLLIVTGDNFFIVEYLCHS